MFKRFAFSLLLSLAVFSGLHAQVVVGDAIPPKDVDQAKETLVRAAPKVLNMNPGEFEAFVQASALPVYWFTLPGSDDCFLRIEVPAGKEITHIGKRRGETAIKLHTLKFDKPWAMVIATKPGRYSSVLFRNGDDNTKPPVQVDQIQLLIGVPPPDPDNPPAPTSDLAKQLSAALVKDKAAGIGDLSVLAKLAGIYSSAAKDNIDDLETFQELDSFLEKAVTLANIPAPDKMLTNLRTKIRDVILKAIGISEADRQAKMTDAHKKAALKVFADIAAALGTLTK